jgi:4-hydroxy-tetrahydrodipicolinate synthase
MRADQQLSGIFAPVLTLLKADLSPDTGAYVRYCRWIVSQGAGLAVFGTNSEANSFSLHERLALLAALIEAGLPADRMMPGTGACALTDSVTLCAAAAKANTAAVLMLPPFYYKDIPEDGLFAFYAETIERVGDNRLKICLYHIPQISGVPIGLSLIKRLIERYPRTVVGIKDSSGDMTNTKAMLEAFHGFRVFCGSERFLVETMHRGGAGSISASANLNPAAIVDTYRHWQSDNAGERQAELNAFRAAFDGFPMIPALKRAVAHYGRYEPAKQVRPPLMPLANSNWAVLKPRLEALGFAAPGLSAALSTYS